MTNGMKVILLIDDESQQEAANAVCTQLSANFGVYHVTVRSSRVSLDPWLTVPMLPDKNAPTDADIDADIDAPADTVTDAPTDIDTNVPAPLLLVHLISVTTNDSSTVTSISSFPTNINININTNAPMITQQIHPVDTCALSIAKYCGLASTITRRLVMETLHRNTQAQRAIDAQFKTKSPYYIHKIATCFDQNQQIIGTTNPTLSGKVRDTHVGATTLALVTTDRQSGFDRQLAVVPYKGAVLNLTAAFWCHATKDIINNHLISIPHPNVSIVKKCIPFPIEFVVRSYLTGSTDTSIWKHYQTGVRIYCGHNLPDGMVKNQPLPQTILTPTTKEDHHDRPISPADIIKEEWMIAEDLQVCHDAALKIFARGQQVASTHGLILVDTKYEFGKDAVTGEILLIDEVHTPDSSRYWLASTYQERQVAGLEPENIDKEFLRLWFRDNCDPYADATIPEAPRDLVLELARRYVTLYEMITWKDFDFDAVTGQDDIATVIEKHLK
jgi:phosphoribosylaminoimidazole-succinocarboxamide synthase